MNPDGLVKESIVILLLHLVSVEVLSRPGHMLHVNVLSVQLYDMSVIFSGDTRGNF